MVEVHTVGQDDWTTLPDVNGGTGTTVPTECEPGFYVNQHPFLRHYLTVGLGRLHGDRHQRQLEQLHRRVRRLAGGVASI